MRVLQQFLQRWIRPMSGTACRELEVVERAYLTPQCTLHLVRRGDRQLLVAVAGGNVHLLESAPFAREHSHA